METPSQQISPQQLNALQRNAVLSSSVEMTQQIYSATIPNATIAGTQLLINPRNVGLIKRFIIIVSGAVSAGTADATITPLGWSNILSQVTFTDLNNNIRVQTGGWHLSALATARHRKPYGGALVNAAYSQGTVPVLDDTVQQYGNNFPVIVAPETAALAGTVTPFRVMFDLPLAYSDDDLRGALYANVVNAVMQIGLTINPNPFATFHTGDNTFAVMSKGSGGTLVFSGDLTVTIYQVYLDQLPIGKQGVVLPILDLSTVYELKSTLFSSIVAANDFPIPYANFRDFLSTFALFNSTGLYTNPGNGSDVNYWALQSANFTNLWKLDPLTAAFNTRQIIGTDMPKALYYFSHRRKPISTTQYGNMELILNANAVSGVPYVSVGWEDFALVNTLTQAGSLAG
jgi:hypothetical protein